VRRPVLAALLLAAFSTGVACAAREGSDRAELRLVRVARVEQPVNIAAPRSEPNNLYIVEKTGRIRVRVNGRLRARPFLDLHNSVSNGSEQGLLSVAFHPRYSRNGLFYVDYTDRGGDTRIVEYRSRGLARRPIRTRQIFFLDDPYSNHNGGQLAFGLDGYLYAGMGDGGSGGGLRNPWRFSFDRLTGDLYIGDVGQNSWEELDYTPRRSPGLENYGWRVYEGKSRYTNETPNATGRLVMPYVVLPNPPNCSVIGGFVYRGSAVASAKGRYFFSDNCAGRVRSVSARGGTSVRNEAFRVDGGSSFGEDARGELYIASVQSGNVYKLAE
jgi:glucose/arabinose dehydrogenase